MQNEQTIKYDEDANITAKKYKKLLASFSKDTLLDIRKLTYYLLEDYFAGSLQLNQNNVNSKMFSLTLDTFAIPHQRVKSIFEEMIFNWYVFEPIREESLEWLTKKNILIPDSFKKNYKINTNNVKNIIQATEELTGEVPLFENGRSGYATCEERGDKTYLLIEVGKEKKSFLVGDTSSKTDKLLRTLADPFLGFSKGIQTVAQEVGITVNSFNQDWKDVEKKLQQR